MGNTVFEENCGISLQGNPVSTTSLLECLDFLTEQFPRSYIRNLLILRSGNNAVAFLLPVLASVLAFVAYSLSGHSLDPAVIFTSLTLFQLLRLPLMFLRAWLGLSLLRVKKLTSLLQPYPSAPLLMPRMRQHGCMTYLLPNC